MNLSFTNLFVSTFWGAIGLGVFVYGKRQKAAIPLFGGALLMGLTYFIESALFLSLASCGLIAGMIYLGRR